MDIRENWEDLTEVFRNAITSQRRRSFANLRVMVAEDSSDGHTVVLQPVTKATVTDLEGNSSQVTLPVLQDVPIHFAGGGGTTATHMIKAGDEGLASFSTMPFDVWHQQGGVQMQIDGRIHSLSDASFHPGGRSDPRKLPQVSTDSHQIRSDDKKMVIDHHPTNGTHIKAADPSTQAASDSFDPFTQATKFFESLTHPSSGIAHNATDGGTTHSVTNTHTAGPMMSAMNGAHTVNAHPTNGVGIISSIAHTISAPNAHLDMPGNLMTSGNISAPSGAISGLSGAFGSLTGIGGAALGVIHALEGLFGSGGVQSQGTVAGATLQTAQAYTVAELNAAMPPSTPLQGTRAFVTDATSSTFMAALSGGGAIVCPAFCDGSNWLAA